MLLSTKEVSKLWGISARRVAVLCAEGRIPNAQRVGANWGVPDNAEKPDDARIKSGKYIKRQQGEKTHG